MGDLGGGGLVEKHTAWQGSAGQCQGRMRSCLPRLWQSEHGSQQYNSCHRRLSEELEGGQVFEAMPIHVLGLAAEYQLAYPCSLTLGARAMCGRDVEETYLYSLPV